MTLWARIDGPSPSTGRGCPQRHLNLMSPRDGRRPSCLGSYKTYHRPNRDDKEQYDDDSSPESELLLATDSLLKEGKACILPTYRWVILQGDGCMAGGAVSMSLYPSTPPPRRPTFCHQVTVRIRVPSNVPPLRAAPMRSG